MLANLFLGLLGLLDVFLIARAKKSPKAACLFGDHECGVVISSKYSKIFLLDNHVWGAWFYSAIVVLSVFTLSGYLEAAENIFVLLAGGGIFFSAYLAGVMLFVLKKNCEYCYLSAGVNIAFFLNVFFFTNFPPL
jgi:uncharacterized membrane protein